MVAAEADPEIDDGPLKLGHTGALSQFGDSEPGLGWAKNLELRDNPDGTTTSSATSPTSPPASKPP